MDQDLQFLTESGVNVTGLIKEGKTKEFTCRKTAYEYAQQIRSYVYDLNCFVAHKKERIVKPFGYAVPK